MSSFLLDTFIQYGTSIPKNQATFTSAGQFTTWTVPAGVTSICVCVLGPGGSGGTNYGGGGGGGGLAYVNNLSVTPGAVYNIGVGKGGTSSGAAGTNSYFSSNTFLSANSGQAGAGGVGGTAGGGGGAAGYSGFGGNGGGYGLSGAKGGSGGIAGGTVSGIVTYTGGYGANGSLTNVDVTTTAGTLGGGGGAGAGGSGSYAGGQGGGAISYQGQSGVDINGFTTTAGASVQATFSPSNQTNGGSGGNSAVYSQSTGFTSSVSFGAGNGGSRGSGSTGYTLGGNGFVRIIWGSGRSFPNTLTTDQ